MIPIAFLVYGTKTLSTAFLYRNGAGLSRRSCYCTPDDRAVKWWAVKLAILPTQINRRFLVQANPYIVEKILKWIAVNHKDGLAVISAKDFEIDQAIILEQLKNMVYDELLSPTPNQKWFRVDYSLPEGEETTFHVSITEKGKQIMLMKEGREDEEDE